MRDITAIDGFYEAMLRDSGVPPSSLDPFQQCLPSNKKVFWKYADTIRNLRKTVDDRFDTDIAVLLRRGNATLPIMRLPEEILLKIFEAYLGSPPNSKFYLLKMNLMGVCSRWLALGRTAPSLWSYLTNYRSENSVRDAIERSGNSLLTVHCYSLEYETVFRPGALCRALVENIGRLHHAYLWLDNEPMMESEVIQLFGLPAPNLETLELKSGDDESEILLETFFQATPRLRRLVLKRVAIPWSDSLLRNLTHLKVDQVIANGTSINNILLTIQGSPNITVIEFFHFNIIPGDAKVTQTCLPLLTTLHLQDVNPTCIDQILAAIDAPNCRDVSLLYELPKDSTPTPLKAPPQWVCDHLVRFAKYSQVRITFRKGNFGKTYVFFSVWPIAPETYDRDLTFEMERSFNSPVECIDGFLGPMLRDAMSVQVVIMNPLDVNETEIIQSFSRLTALTDLQFTTSRPLGNFLTFLKTPLNSHESESEWSFPFPKLAKLTFCNTTVEAGEVLSLVRSRYQSSDGKPLELRIGAKEDDVGMIGMTEDVFYLMETILGRGQVVWERPKRDRINLLDYRTFDPSLFLPID